MKKILVIILSLVSAISLAQTPSMISDFYQGRVVVSSSFQDCTEDYDLGNCATIALIKAALVEFGSIDNIFKSYNKNPNGINCVFMDNISATVNPTEIDLVKRLSGIKFRDSSLYYEDAIIIYALICKRLENSQSIVCIKNFENSVEYLNSGYITVNAPSLLGLKSEKVKVRDIKKNKAVIIRSRAHAAFATNGVQDILGKPYKIKFRWMKNPIGIGGFIHGAFKLIKP